MTEFAIQPVPVYTDNYVWLIFAGAQTWVVDPGDHQPVIQALEELGRTPSGILITHHHWDHITGITPLVNHFQTGERTIPIYGPHNPAIAAITHRVTEGDSIVLGDFTARVWATPGHTFDHLSYYLPDQQSLFCGDTLFAAGCGRLFDGTMEQLYESLQRIARLPRHTRIYCTHEYTLANINFALAVEPQNTALHNRAAECRVTREHNRPTLPTSIALELETNPYLRTQLSSVQMAVARAANIELPLKKNTATQALGDFLTFAELRKWKNRY